ncbi:MAG: DNA/RNA non-specific endonuclease [Cellvibrionaceae bacterium]|nr:DNA/RNA non-specific endonuclease [Cellvibrionaceae bacterium]
MLIYSTHSFAQSIPDCPVRPYIIQKPKDMNHLRYAPLQRERLYHGGGFVAAVDNFDDDNGDGQPEYLVQPSWVAYQLNAYASARISNYAPSYKRPKDWYRLNIFNLERKHYQTNKSVDNSYDGIGKKWNRGHLALRADMNRLGEAYGCNSHVFTNAVPQNPLLNAGIWLGLENYVSSLSNQLGKLWVVTGPVYTQGEKIRYIGQAHKKEIPVAIPNAMFKVIIVEVEGGVQAFAFIFPNQFDTPPPAYLTGKCQDDQYYNFAPFLVSLSAVEQATGLRFFSADNALEPFKKIKAPSLYRLENQYKVGYCNGGLEQP